MAIFELFSKKQKMLRGEMPDVYRYDEIPKALRVQIVHIWTEILGDSFRYQDVYKFLVDVLCREYGVFKLWEPKRSFRERDYMEEFTNAFMNEDNAEKCLDFIQISFRMIDVQTRKYDYANKIDASEQADAAIQELNARFKEHGVGYQYITGEIIRIDSELIHAEVVKPALKLLNQTLFLGAHEEYLKAHEHYRHGDYKEALNECLKAFESVMKAICKKHKWPHPSDATAKTLIQVCLNNELIPAFWQQHYSSLRSLLESSVPTGRNKLSGHGQGTAPVVVPDYLAAYMLHMTAASIVFLAEAEKNMK